MYKIILILSLYLLSVNAWSLCVKDDNVNLRDKPDGKAKVTWTVGKFMPLKQIKRKGAWLQVKDVDNQSHWIHRSVVDAGMSCAVVKATKATLRTGPGTQHGSTDLASVGKYAAFRKLARDDAWLKLKDDYDNIHWVHESTMWEPLQYTSLKF